MHRFALVATILFCIACTNADVPSGPSGAAPTLTSMTPTSGRVGSEVTLHGAGFAATGNHIKFGSGYVKNLASPDGATLRFAVPDGLDLCAPHAAGPCPGGFPRVTSGEYVVSVLGSNSESNAITFVVRE